MVLKGINWELPIILPAQMPKLTSVTNDALSFLNKVTLCFSIIHD